MSGTDLEKNRFLSEIAKIPRAYLGPVFFGRKKVLLKPNFISLEMEDRCCFKCLQCDIWKKKKTLKRLNLTQTKEVILKLKNWLGFYQLGLAGGEPLMNRQILSVISFASSNRIFVHLNTNGWLVDKEKAEGLVKSGLGSLSFSLDSLTEKDHDRTRGKKGAFKRVMKAIDYVLEAKSNKKEPFVSLTTIIFKKNLKSLPRLVEFVKKKGLDAIYFQPLWHNFGASHFDSNWFTKSELWPKDSKKVNQILDQLVKMKKNDFPIGNSLFELKEYKSYFRDPLQYGEKKHCYVGINSFNIALDGRVRLCFDFESIGDLTKQSPEEVWNGIKAQGLRKKIAKCQRGCKILLCNMPLSKREAGNLFINLSTHKIRKILGLKR